VFAVSTAGMVYIRYTASHDMFFYISDTFTMHALVP
jgi:hypothetical protein